MKSLARSAPQLAAGQTERMLKCSCSLRIKGSPQLAMESFNAHSGGLENFKFFFTDYASERMMKNDNHRRHIFPGDKKTQGDPENVFPAELSGAFPLFH